jgi:ribosomal protein RSM22 (predicted rRNA methylase)
MYMNNVCGWSLSILKLNFFSFFFWNEICVNEFLNMSLSKKYPSSRLLLISLYYIGIHIISTNDGSVGWHIIFSFRKKLIKLGTFTGIINEYNIIFISAWNIIICYIVFTFYMITYTYIIFSIFHFAFLCNCTHYMCVIYAPTPHSRAHKCIIIFTRYTFSEHICMFHNAYTSSYSLTLTDNLGGTKNCYDVYIIIYTTHVT